MIKFTSIMISAVMLVIVSTGSIGAQLLSYPESVVYDSLRNRYLVSSWNNGNLVEIDSNGTQSYVYINQGCFAGLCIVGDSLFVASKDEGVKGFDLETGEMFMDLAIPNTQLLNDIAADTSGFIYMSDPQVHKIIRVRISDQSFSTFVQSGLNVPNGLVHDKENNRMIVVSARSNSPIQAVNLADSSLSTIIPTALDILDGISRDNDGNYYISSWGSSSVYRFNPEFSGVSEIFSTHNPQPADIFFDKINNVLAVPEFYMNEVSFVDLVTDIYDWDSVDGQIPDNITLYQNYPNPFNPVTQISFDLPVSSPVVLNVYDVLGRKIETLTDGYLEAGHHSILWDARDVTGGIYLYMVETPGYSISQKMCLLK